MKKVHLILADASLELVPPEIWSHPAVLQSARRRKKRPGETLLDKSLHYSAMKALKDKEKRGRPDIIHVSLLVSQSSVLNMERVLETIIHTVEGKVIEVNPATRIPRNYNRFVGLMEQLLIAGKVPPSSATPLMRVLEADLNRVIEERKIDFVALLSEKGDPTTPRKIAERLKGYENPAFIVGAFPHGDFSEEIYSMADGEFSLGSKTLDAWYVVARIITSLEDVLNLWRD